MFGWDQQSRKARVTNGAQIDATLVGMPRLYVCTGKENARRTGEIEMSSALTKLGLFTGATMVALAAASICAQTLNNAPLASLPANAPVRPSGPPSGTPQRQAPKEGTAKQLTPHVWVMRGYPNVAIIVGSKAMLVVDTGLGADVGAGVARTAAKLGKAQTLYLTTTHFHPEHAAGEGGFPPGTILIRAKVQQNELEADNGRILEMFSRMSGDALKGFHYRKPDRVFAKTETLDLGGVHAVLLYRGPAHTRGDEEVLVPEDSVLVTGDVVQNRVGPNLTADGVGPRAWIETVEALRPLNPKLVVPDHSDPGPGVPMIEAQIEFLKALDDRAHTLKAQGVPVAQAGATITAELKARYPDWQIRDLNGAVAKAYAE
jgi:glyoxylase-like metal-dependent hydrolase (beta-lactamase superfamily II)